MKKAILAAVVGLTGLAGNGLAGLSSNMHERIAHELNRFVQAHPHPERLFLREGLVADSGNDTIVLWALSTQVTANDPIEFVLIGEDSGHDYEALAVAAAKPGAVRDALEFLGMRPGRPANPSALVFWPRGERVLVSFVPAGSDSDPVRAEDLIWDRGTGVTLRRTGFVFTGASMIALAGDPDHEVYEPDALEPHSIISIYNEPGSVMDVPRQAPQGSVYGRQQVNPGLMPPTNTLLRITLRPERLADGPRVTDIGITVAPATEDDADPAPVFLVTGGGYDGTALAADALAAAIRAWVGAGHDPFVTLSFDPALTLGELRAACALLATLEGEDGIRVDPPPEGHLYYKAFLPNEHNRERANRFAQPWELHLHATNGAPAATLVEIEELWPEDGSDPELKIADHPLGAPEDLETRLAELDPGMSVILVYAPPGTTYRRLMAYLAPVLDTHGMVHVYLEPESEAPEAPE